jgi:diketogulonate reductase-like aldo/keto reductase
MLSNGVELPMIGLGVWQYSSAVATKAFEDAFAVGFDSIDTAHDYNNQDGVGTALKDILSNGTKRGALFVTSKVPGCGEQGVGSGKSCGPDTKKVFEEDLSLMGVDYADLMLVHFPPGSCSAMKCTEIQAQ